MDEALLDGLLNATRLADVLVLLAYVLVWRDALAETGGLVEGDNGVVGFRHGYWQKAKGNEYSVPISANNSTKKEESSATLSCDREGS